MNRQWDESAIRVRPNKKGSRPRTKDRPTYDNAEIGRIITVDRGRYTAVIDEGKSTAREVTAVRAKELRRNPVVVGDLVGLVGDTSGRDGSLARLVKITERDTVLMRSADDTDPYERVVVANATQLLIVVAAAHPEPRTGFIDRSIVAAFNAGITPILCITKTDLKQPVELENYYEESGLRIVLSEASDGRAPSEDGSQGLTKSLVDPIRTMLDGEISVLLGHSGVGKSTLVNALTGSQRNTGHVNAVTGRGRHTSSSAVALHPADSVAGTWVIDTPGIRSFGLAHIPEENIVAAFTELAPGSAACPKGCMHSAHAVGCGIARLVSEGKVGNAGPARLDSLRKLLGVAENNKIDREKELGIVD